jgi:prepilin-type N-terminal cleavage/methylation domain-containing protein
MQSPNTSIRARGPTSTRASKRGGFTLVEIVVVMAIFALLIGLGLFVSMDAYRGYSFRSERDVVVSELQKARSRAMANVYQTTWGLCYIAPNYIVFRGTTCAAGIATNEVLLASQSVTIAGLTPPGIVFTQVSGTAAAAIITVTQNARTSSININNEGTINW